MRTDTGNPQGPIYNNIEDSGTDSDYWSDDPSEQAVNRDDDAGVQEPATTNALLDVTQEEVNEMLRSWTATHPVHITNRNGQFMDNHTPPRTYWRRRFQRQPGETML